MEKRRKCNILNLLESCLGNWACNRVYRKSIVCVEIKDFIQVTLIFAKLWDVNTYNIIKGRKSNQVVKSYGPRCVDTLQKRWKTQKMTQMWKTPQLDTRNPKWLGNHKKQSKGNTLRWIKFLKANISFKKWITFDLAR